MLRAVRDACRIERDPGLDKAETRKFVQATAVLSTNFLLMNAAATLIAVFGLLADSEAVIIGAMLIAMLYGPLLGIGLALAELDRRLLMRAIVAEVVGALWVFLIALGLGWLNPDIPIGHQLLARTAPNLLDLMIALVGGAAGAYAAASPKISSAAVGVAIATALCPPLASCGILVAHGYPQLATGALLLFVTNMTAIAVAAMFVFLLLGHRAHWNEGAGLAARLLPLLVLVVLGAYLLAAFRQTVDEASLRNRTLAALEEELQTLPGARIVELRLASDRGRRLAYAVVRTPAHIDRETVVRLDDAVDRTTGRDISLHVRSVLVDELTRDGRATPDHSEHTRLRR